MHVWEKITNTQLACSIILNLGDSMQVYQVYIETILYTS